MLRDRNIAFFIDVDNVGLSSEQYADIMERLGKMGSVLCGKIYGAGERKHKEIHADADSKGYVVVRPMRVKRRGRKDFDHRIFVDVVDTVARTAAVDAVCIVAQPTDLVHLYSYLHGRGVKVIALANADEDSNALIDEVLDIGLEAPVKPVKKTAPKTTPKTTPKATAKKQPAKQEQPAPVEESSANTAELLSEIEQLRSIADTPDEEPATEAAQQPASSAPRSSGNTPSNERDLIKRIEEIRQSGKGDDDDLVDEIKKLLDGLE